MSHSDSSSGSSSGAPSDAMMIMLAPDGYYTYLQIPKTSSGEQPQPADLDLIKKNYRKLSIKHQ
jgi:hypothetical protein